MKKSSGIETNLKVSKLFKAILVSIYALLFYFAPVLSDAQKQDAKTSWGQGNNILIAFFNKNFEFGDY